MLIAGECAPVVKRDFSNLPAGRVGFDDLCGLQDYFDDLSTRSAMPPVLVSSSELQKARVDAPLAGHARFAFETDYQLKVLRRILHENWRRLPSDLDTAPRIELEVEWSSRSGLKRVVTDRNAELIVGRERTPLPHQVCLSELLFGEPLYRRRREVLVLAPLSPRRFNLSEPTSDGGSSDAVSSDGAAGGSDVGSTTADAAAGAAHAPAR